MKRRTFIARIVTGATGHRLRTRSSSSWTYEAVPGHKSMAINGEKGGIGAVPAGTLMTLFKHEF
jgi:hypothetical protein